MVFFIQILAHFPLVKPNPKVQSWVIQRGQLIPIGFKGRLLEHDFIMSPQVTNRLLIGTVHVALLLRSVTGCLMIPVVLCSSGSLRLAVIIGVAVGAFLALIVLIGTLGAFCCARLQRSKWACCFYRDRNTEATRTARPLRHPPFLVSTCDAVLHNLARLYPHMHNSVGI